MMEILLIVFAISTAFFFTRAWVWKQRAIEWRRQADNWRTRWELRDTKIHLDGLFKRNVQ